MTLRLSGKIKSCSQTNIESIAIELLYLIIRDPVLNVDSAERVVVSRERRDGWRDALD
jgi:hypothetical protein